MCSRKSVDDLFRSILRIAKVFDSDIFYKIRLELKKQKLEKVILRLCNPVHIKKQYVLKTFIIDD